MREHDPYWDIPLNDSLPKPVIDLIAITQAGESPAKTGPAKKQVALEGILD